MKNENIEIKKQKSGVVSSIISIILWILVILVFLVGILGLLNFNRVQNNEKLILLLDEKHYKNGEEQVDVYNFGVYKIVKQSDEKTYTYSLRLWFLDDINKK